MEKKQALFDDLQAKVVEPQQRQLDHVHELCKTIVAENDELAEENERLKGELAQAKAREAALQDVIKSMVGSRAQ